MSKVVQAFLSGMFFTFILDFFLFLGIKINYIDANSIDLYYNILFADNQNIFLFLFFTILLGYITLYLSNKIALIVIIPLFIFVFSTLFKPVGVFVAETILMQKGARITTEKFLYKGDIYYRGRKYITFYDHRFKKFLKLENNKITGGI